MKELLKSVLKRISGTGGDPVIQLKTAFGGGKTHSLLAVYHIAKQEKPLSSLNGISEILNSLNIVDLPKSKIVVIDGTNQDPSQPRVYNNINIKTLWGDIAWQLGGFEAYETVKANDIDGTAPTKDTFISLLTKYGPVVILMDELVRYISQFKENKEYFGGTYNSNLSFIQNLTEAVKQVPNAILLASLPESNREAGDEHGEETLKTLEHYFGRVQAIWRPIETQESFEIVRRRLFKPITDDIGRKEICKAFSELYTQNPDDFTPETQESSYYNKLIRAYPIHPELLERLYNDWSSLPNFQRTRGVLKLMAKVISDLWIKGNTDLLIMPGNLPLDSEAKSEFLSYLPTGWDPVIDSDIDGKNSASFRIDASQTRLGKDLACRKVSRTIFLGTAPGSQNRLKKGIDKKDIMLGVVEPEQSIATYSDALDQISNKLHYLNVGDGEYWFDIRQNLTKEMEERKKRFNKDEFINKEIKKILVDSIKPNGFIQAVHVFTPDNDIPDDKNLRLVVLLPGENINKNNNFSTAQTHAGQILKNHGVQLRKYQNRLIFLASDENCVGRFKDNIVSMLAWNSIVSDYDNDLLTLDNIKAKFARKNLETVTMTAKQSVTDCYKYLIIPEVDCMGDTISSEPDWKIVPIKSNLKGFINDIIKYLKDEEDVIDEWAPIHLKNQLSKWYWDKKDYVSANDFWDDSCRYLYLPRLSNETVLQKAIEDGTKSIDYFGIAYGYENEKYVDFRFGDSDKYYIKDGSALIINPDKAEEYAKSIVKDILPEPTIEYHGGLTTDNDKPSGQGTLYPNIGSTGDKTTYESKTDKRFFGSVLISQNTAVSDISEINKEIIRRFTDIGADVKITLEIEATSKKGFNHEFQRIIKENCNGLKFDSDNTDFAEE